MDIATIIGIVSAFALVVGAISFGGGLSMFINVPSLLIVVGGTLGATMVNYALKDILKVILVAKNAFFHQLIGTSQLIANFVELSNRARRQGILALEPAIKEADDEFLRTGLQLCVDGLEPQVIRDVLETEIQNIQSRHTLGADIFSTMGTFAPALGMIGTLIGLVQMLQTMNDPSNIGPAMAVALITTFYGALLANIVFLPISGKLKNRNNEEVVAKEMVMEGILSISRGDNPRMVEQKLNSFLPSKTREYSFK